MAADPDFVKAFIGHLEKLVADNEAQIKAMKEEGMRLRECGPETGNEWRDVTDARIKWLEDKNASHRNLIERAKKDYA